MAKSPSQRTLEYLRRLGWPNVQSVEKWIPQARRRKDLFRFADILAMHPEWGHLYVQATTGSHVNARLEKMLLFAEDEIEDALRCGARVEVHGWRQLKGKGRQKWFPIVKNVTLEVLHQMNDEQWRVIREYMFEVWQTIEGSTARDKDLVARVALYDFPPSIQVIVELEGGADRESDHFTSKELERAADLAVEITEHERHEWPELVLKKVRTMDKWKLGFALRPEEYRLVPGVSDVR